MLREGHIVAQRVVLAGHPLFATGQRNHHSMYRTCPAGASSYGVAAALAPRRSSNVLKSRRVAGLATAGAHLIADANSGDLIADATILSR